MSTLVTGDAPAAPAAPAPAAPAAPAGAPAPAAGSTPPAGDPAAAPVAPAAGAPAGDGTTPPGEGGEVVKTPEQIEADRVAAEAAAEAAKPAGAPEKYETFTPPEGGQLDDAVMAQFSDVARELNLPQDKAQLLIDKVAPVIAQRQAEQIETMRTTWAEASTADTEFGGAKLEESKAHAAKAMTAFASPELKTLLNDTGLGNHPELVRFMVRAGKAISEDKVVTGGVPASIRTAAEVLYPSSSLKK